MPVTLRIRHWHRHYRATRATAEAAERAAPPRVAAALQQSLEALPIGSDELVLIRAINVRVDANRRGYTDAEIFDQWGQSLADAVHAAIELGDPRVVRRYADAIDYLVEFLLAVITGGDIEAWHFARLKPLLHGEPADTLDAVLLHALDQWPALLHRLNKRRALAPILRRCSPAVRERLWRDGVLGNLTPASSDSARPLFAAALDCLRNLGGLVPSGDAAEHAFSAFVRRYVPPVNWSDPAQLAAGVCQALQLLIEEFGCDISDPHALGIAVQGMDWLDREFLTRQMSTFLAMRSSRGSPIEADCSGSEAPLNSAAREGDAEDLSLSIDDRLGAAPWETLARCIKPRLLAEWDPADPTGHFNRHLALALLIEADASLAGDLATTTFVEQLLTGLAERTQSGRTAPAPPSDIVTAGALVLKPPTTFDSNSATRRTAFAGLFLLLRATHDLRLPELARATSFPAPRDQAASQLLLELAQRWSGHRTDWPFDPGLIEFVRIAASTDPLAARPAPLEPTPDSEAQFQSRLVRTLVGLGDWHSRAVIRVALAESRGGEPYLLGGDIAGRFAPWSHRVSSRLQACEALRRWQDQMSAWTAEPVTVTSDRATATYLGDFGGSAADFDTALPHPESGAAPEFADGAAAATLAATADATVRHWAQWIRGFRGATCQYLLDQLVRRSGMIYSHERRVIVTLDPRPLDVALQLSGLFDNFIAMTRDGARTVEFVIARHGGRSTHARVAAPRILGP